MTIFEDGGWGGSDDSPSTPNDPPDVDPGDYDGGGAGGQ